MDQRVPPPIRVSAQHPPDCMELLLLSTFSLSSFSPPRTLLHPSSITRSLSLPLSFFPESSIRGPRRPPTHLTRQVDLNDNETFARARVCVFCLCVLWAAATDLHKWWWVSHVYHRYGASGWMRGRAESGAARLQEPSHHELGIGLKSCFTAACCARAAKRALINGSIKRRVPESSKEKWRRKRRVKHLNFSTQGFSLFQKASGGPGDSGHAQMYVSRCL